MIQINEIKSWWIHLSTREHRILTAGGVLLILFLLYLIIIQPINTGLNNQINNIDAQKKLLSWMQTSVPELKALRKSGDTRQTIPAGGLLSSVEQSLKQSQLSEAVTALEKNPDETSQESIQLKFDKVNFDRFMTWLINFWQTYDINISQISVTRTPAAGIVQISLSLSLPKQT